jgi:hypothetical protein
LFAFPFTDYQVSKEFFEGIKQDVDLCFGTAGLRNDIILFHLQRIGAEKNKIKSLELILKKEYLKYMVKFVVHLERNKKVTQI